MARKGREPLVEAPPPAASSSDEELSSDEEVLSDNETQQQRDVESSSADETPPSSPSPPKKPPTQKKPDPPKPAHESDSDSDTDSDTPPTKVKPIESKPMDSANLKKARSKPAAATTPVTVLASPALTATATKRKGAETEKGTPTKKARREKVEGGNDEGGKKPLFQRLWSEDDEIVILEGMIEYKGKKGVDPMTDAENFLEFIKKSLHVDVNRGQIMSKVRTLKKRFENAQKKKKIADPHGVRLFELSKKIWEFDGVNSHGGGVDGKDSNLNSKAKKKKGGVEKLKGGKEEEVNGLVSEDEEDEEEKLQDWVVSRREKEVKLEDMGNCGFLQDGVLKEGMKLLDEGEKAKLGEKWRKHNLEEMEVYLKRLDLIKELTQKTLNAIKSDSIG